MTEQSKLGRREVLDWIQDQSTWSDMDIVLVTVHERMKFLRLEKCMKTNGRRVMLNLDGVKCKGNVIKWIPKRKRFSVMTDYGKEVIVKESEMGWEEKDAINKKQ